MLIQIHVMIQRQINKLIKIKENFVNTDQSVILILQKREREKDNGRKLGSSSKDMTSK